MVFMRINIKKSLIFLIILLSCQSLSQNLIMKKSGSKALSNKNAVTVPFEFVFDPNSSYNTYKNITSVNLPAVFDGWNTSSNPLVYDTVDKVWKTTVSLDPAEYEYKFYLNNIQWTEDPDNPLNRGITNNSVAIVKSVDSVYFKNFSNPNGKIYTDLPTTFSLSAKVIPVTTKSLDSIKVYYCDESNVFNLVPSSYSVLTKNVSVNLNKENLRPGINQLKFIVLDQQKNIIGNQTYSFGIYSDKSGFNYIDDFQDENLNYPSYIPSGSADIMHFNILANNSLDSLMFSIKLKKISDFSRIGFEIFSNLSSKYTSEIPNIKLQTNDWSDQGVFVILMDPLSPYCDTSKYNLLYSSKNPETKIKKITVIRDSLINNKFVFKIAVSDLNKIMGQYSGKRYYTLYSYLSDNTGNDFQVSQGSINQPSVYDVAFAKRYRQNILLSNYNQTRISRLDVEGRGVIGILPEEINADLKSEAPTVKLLTRSNPENIISFKTIDGTIDDPAITSVDIFRNDVKWSSFPVTNGTFSVYVSLVEGDNLIRAVAKNSKGISGSSSAINIKYIVDHSPKPVMLFSDLSTAIKFDAAGSTDPDNDISSYFWQSDDKVNPVRLNISSNGATFQTVKPVKAGEYYFNLTIIDKSGNSTTIRNYFILDSLGNLTLPDVNSNPQWVKDAIVYEIFVKSFSPGGDLNSITKKIQYLKELGINTLWLMPIMHNQGTVSEMSGGYSIDDFYNIAPQFGALSDYKTLVDSAHANGIKVVLDITQNHVADHHPWVDDIRMFGKYSNYYNFIERTKLGDDRGMGQTLNSDGIYMRYSNWTLANLNVSDVECKNYMIKMFKWWLVNNNSDGFRFDVYWGPQNRYGQSAFWRPARIEMKNVKPDIFILGETDGTGNGSEINYSDMGGACDAAYDWAFYTAAKQIFSTQNVTGLNNIVTNYSYSPGKNSYFFRFLENHDEDRIAGLVSPDRNKNILALLMTVPGIPMIYMGQEVGWTGKRDQVNFDNPVGAQLLPYYKRIIGARKIFPAFRTKLLKTVSNNESSVYSYVRPYKNENAIVVLNFSGNPKSVSVNINESSDLDLSSSLDENRNYFLSDFANDTYYTIKKNDLKNLQLNLAGFEARVMILSDRIYKIKTSIGQNADKNLPKNFSLKQNYPNPFNPATSIDYSVAEAGNIKIVVFDMLGREVKTLVNEFKNPGEYKTYFDSTGTSGGVYFYKLFAGSFIETKKMILIK
jgi:glycosidase